MMKDMIKFHYNIEIDKIEQQNDEYYFQKNENYFFMYPFFRSTKELEDIYQICQELKKMSIPVHTFILNKENKLITQINDTNYILLKAEENPNKEYNIIDIRNIENSLHLLKNKSDLYRNQWGELWSKKIDYFEYQIRELGKEKKVVLNSLTYYIGLAENAISYVNNTIQKANIPNGYTITLSHKRIHFPNFSKDYLNPLTFIFDLKIRDVVEYIKKAFFTNEKEAWIEIKAYLDAEYLTQFEYQMLFGRLLYPSYYFDIYEQIMNKQASEEELIPYIRKAKDYEIFLNKIFIEISKKSSIEKIDWLSKEKML